MTNYNALSAEIFRILSNVDRTGEDREESRSRIVGAIELFKRDVSAKYERGHSATTEEKLQLRQLFEFLRVIACVSSFVQKHRGDYLFREVGPYEKFGEQGAWIFEMLTDRSSYRFGVEQCIRGLLEAFECFDPEKFSVHGEDEESFFTLAERQKIWDENM